MLRPQFSAADPQDENKIGIDGIQKFCDDLALDPASISILVVAWKFRAATQCEFSKKEFIEGMVDLGWDVLQIFLIKHYISEVFTCQQLHIIYKMNKLGI